jgi:hypothetical protein
MFSDLALTARRARISTEYLASVLAGRRLCPFALAQRLASITGQPLQTFLKSNARRNP